MNALKAQVRNGRLVLDEPTQFPEGTVLELTVADPGDDLDEAERAKLHEALAESWEEARSGKLIPADDVLAKLRSAR